MFEKSNTLKIKENPLVLSLVTLYLNIVLSNLLPLLTNIFYLVYSTRPFTELIAITKQPSTSYTFDLSVLKRTP